MGTRIFIFRFRWIPFVATVIVIVIGVLLGQWQTRRAMQKEAIEQKLSEREAEQPITLGAVLQNPDAVEFRRVVVKGRFLPDWALYLDNRSYRGVAGFYVLMPFEIAGSDMHVLVARGWVRRDPAERARLPAFVTSDGEVEIRGVAKRHLGHLLQLGQVEALRPNAILQNIDITQFAAASKLQLQPFFIEQQNQLNQQNQRNDMQDGLVRDWPRLSSGIDKHRGYAFQWYGLAAMALIFFVVTGFQRGTKRAAG